MDDAARQLLDTHPERRDVLVHLATIDDDLFDWIVWTCIIQTTFTARAERIQGDEALSSLRAVAVKYYASLISAPPSGAR